MKEWYCPPPKETKPKTNPCPYLVKYSPDILKRKTKVLDILNTDKQCFIKKIENQAFMRYGSFS